jgi:protein MpaA
MINMPLSSFFKIFILLGLSFGLSHLWANVKTNQDQAVELSTAGKFSLTDPIKKMCSQLETKFQEYNWGAPLCENFNWNHIRNSNLGTPLIWTVFGDENSDAAKANTTLILCGVHGDEITPIKFCWDLMNELNINKMSHDKLIVIAPLVA